MSKKEVKEEVQEVVTENNKIETSIETLTAQLKDYREKAQYFQMMCTKAEGALEVLVQLSDRKEEPKDK